MVGTVKIVFQFLTLLILFEFLFLLYRANTQNQVKESELESCFKCRINVSTKTDIKVDILTVKNGTRSKASNDKSAIKCNRNPKENVNVLIDLKDIKISEKNVFFVESSCGTRTLLKKYNSNSSNFLFNARQSCAVESTARNNPSRNLYMVHTCPLRADFLSEAPTYVIRLLELRNIQVVRVNLTELFQESPIQHLFESGRVDKSKYPVVHSSDLIRILLLWKYGGTYSDLDFINIKPLDELGTNFAGLQDHTINNAYLNFEPDGFGYYISTRILQHLKTNFDGNFWPKNGPHALTQVIIKEECKVVPLTKNECNAFTVYDRSVFYPIFFPELNKLFDNTSSEDLIISFKKTAFSVHFWNLQSKVIPVYVGSNQTYGLLADEFCPSVYRNCGPIF